MRVLTLAILAFLSITGIAAAAGKTEEQTVSMAGFSKVPGWAHPLQHSIPGEPWRGKRVRLTLSLGNDGDARLNVALLIAKKNGVFLTALPRSGGPDGDGRKTLQFVMDVPDDATRLAVRVNLGAKGIARLENINFEAVGADVPVSVSRREANLTLFDGPMGSYSFGNSY